MFNGEVSRPDLVRWIDGGYSRLYGQVEFGPHRPYAGQ